ncbi:MAG: divergent polysaccharide deacetylase family protein [Candidatus Omnitrophota bacterium]|nr:divergent polysaccharide deacetylase family protein [Candidatus Omnitrophota bacterium]
MSKFLRISLLIILILTPIIFYKTFYKGKGKRAVTLPILEKRALPVKPKIALIFDDLGESLKDLEAIHSLHIPLTISIVPGLKFSKNISYMGSRCGFSVLIHLPLQPKEEQRFVTSKYKFISSSMGTKEIDSLLRYYLNYIRLAIGVNNHMGSAATENPELMRHILRTLKSKGLIFIDSRTSFKSVACEIAKQEGVACGYNESFVDSVNDPLVMERKLKKIIKKAKDKGKIIIIAHPKKNTIKVLENKLPELKKEVDFITIRDYFNL